MEYVVVDERALPAGGVICAIILALAPAPAPTLPQDSDTSVPSVGQECVFYR